MRLARRSFATPADLPPRTRAIVALVAEGHPSREVARRLSISARTVGECVHEVARELPGPGKGRVRIMRWWQQHPPAVAV